MGSEFFGRTRDFWLTFRADRKYFKFYFICTLHRDGTAGLRQLRSGDNTFDNHYKNSRLPADEKAVAINEGNAENAAGTAKTSKKIQGQSARYATKVDGTLSKRGRESDVGLLADVDSNADFDGDVLHAV